MKADEKFDFGAALKELEDITAWFESENVDLDEGLSKFERGMELAGKLKVQLEATQNRVEKIKLKFDGASVEPSPASSQPAADDAQLF